MYQLSYQDQYKNEYELYLLYDPADGGIVRLKNQPQLEWKRMGAYAYENLWSNVAICYGTRCSHAF